MESQALSQNPKPKKLAKKNSSWDRFTNALITIIPFIGFMLFMLLPMIVSLITSFFEMHSSNFGEATFIGVNNYVSLFTGDQGMTTLKAYRTTLIYCINVPISMVIGLICAYFLQKVKKGRQVFNTIFFNILMF